MFMIFIGNCGKRKRCFCICREKAVLQGMIMIRREKAVLQGAALTRREEIPLQKVNMQAVSGKSGSGHWKIWGRNVYPLRMRAQCYICI